MTEYPKISNAVDAVITCGDYVLLIKRGKEPGKGMFALPGGFVEENETLQQAAIRETKEETGIDLYSYGFSDDWEVFRETYDDPKRDPRGRVITVAHSFNLHNYGPPPKLEAGDDAAEAHWVGLTRIDEIEDQFFLDHYKIINDLR